MMNETRTTTTEKQAATAAKHVMSKVRTADGRLGMPVTTDVAAVYAKLRSGDNAGRVMKIAQKVATAVLGSGDHIGTLIGTDELPYLLFSATFGKGGFDDVRQRTQLVLLTIVCGEGAARLEQLKALAAQLPYTLLAFTGCSQKTLKVVVPCCYGDGSVPQTDDDYVAFLREGYLTAARLYEALLGLQSRPADGSNPTGPYIKPSEGGLLAGCRMSDDPTAVYRPDAQAVVVVRRNVGADIELTAAGDVEKPGVRREEERLKLEYYACLDKAREEASDPEEVVQALAHYCHKAQLPEELCVRETMLRWVSVPVSDDLKRRIFRSVYKKPFAQGRPRSQMNEKECIARFIKDFFERRYELRYNEVKQIEEFRSRSSLHEPWRPLTQRDLKRIAIEEMMEGGYGWSIDIETYVQSTLVLSYNPITEFLYAAEHYYDPGHDYIGELARRVPTDYADWEKYFHRWMLAMVAQWLGRNRDFGNAVVPMLIGRQGTHKSTFCKMLLPRALREYYMDDIKMDNAEQVERVLGRMALVNIDEYNAKTDREQAKIKRLLTEKDVQVRKMRSDQYTLTARLCSFIATTNDMQPLPGGDGTRRYLCVEVTGVIDTDTPVNYPRLYAQAMHEISHGHPFRFFPDEEAAIQEHNRPYQHQTSSTEVLLTFFAPATKTAAHFMKAVAIQQELRAHFNAADVPNIKQLTVTLKQCGFPYGALKGQRGWYARRLFDEV